MSPVRTLRAFISQRLEAAVDDIIGMFERTITELEEIHRRLRAGVSVVSVDVPVETSAELQDLRCSNIKEEPGDMWTSRDGQQREDVQVPAVSVKSEDDEEAGAAGPEAVRGSDAAFDLDITGFLKSTSDGQLLLSRCLRSDPDQREDGRNHRTGAGPASEPQTDAAAASHPTELYQLPACSKIFTLNTDPQKHVTRHSGEKHFSCSVCRHTFRQKGSLHTHEETQRRETLRLLRLWETFLPEWNSGCSPEDPQRRETLRLLRVQEEVQQERHVSPTRGSTPERNPSAARCAGKGSVKRET
ncbi:uncharacterized protein [Embiotoca jacksoni]|uniref:uncharacterized protein n=1 Tax=Embiotoca jacksoni TaxID=100190 RepID=UPI0037042DEB